MKSKVLREFLVNLAASEDHVRWHANSFGPSKITFHGGSLDLENGLCCQALLLGDGAAEALGKLCKVYGGLNGLRSSFPVPAPTHGNDGLEPNKTRARNVYFQSGPKEMWGEGTYADNRWDFIHWCIKKLG